MLIEGGMRLPRRMTPQHPSIPRRLSTRPSIFDLRYRSLIRGNVLVAASLTLAFFLSDFPHNRATLWLVAPLALSIAGTVETVRCIRRRWSFYHAGVILCIYMDLMALAMVLFFLLYPYSRFLTSST